MALVGYGFFGSLNLWLRTTYVIAAACFLSPLTDIWQNMALAALGAAITLGALMYERANARRRPTDGLADQV
jgi:hypothetical protein